MSWESFDPLFIPGFHALTLPEIEQSLVTADRFSKSRTRRRLFERLTEVVARFHAAAIPGELWIDGSFVTSKIDPNDLDLCLRIQCSVIDRGSTQQVAAVEWFLQIYATHRVDGYLLMEYPPTDPRQAEGLENYVYWLNQYGRARNGSLRGIVVLSLVQEPK